MTRKKTKFCLSWPNKTLKISGRLRNIGILLTDRTIMPYWNLILPLNSLFYRMWRHFLLDDLDTQKVPSVAECSPPPLVLVSTLRRWCSGGRNILLSECLGSIFKENSYWLSRQEENGFEIDYVSFRLEQLIDFLLELKVFVHRVHN